jgi:hypothetical protein
MAIGSIASVGTAGTTVTLTGSAVFTSATSYVCTATNRDSSVAVRVNQVSGTQITLYVATATDNVNYVCIGN